MQGQVQQAPVFLPPHEKFALPSKGLAYKNEIPDTIEIRAMTSVEESILTSERLIKSGEAIDMVFANCIKGDVNVKELLSADKMAILLWLRAASYGPLYNIEVECPSCRFKFERTVNLETDLAVNYAPDDFQEPLTIALPRTKKKVLFQLPRAKHEDIVAKLKEAAENQAKGRLLIDRSMIERMLLCIVDVEGVDKVFWRTWLENLVAGDTSVLRDALTKDYFGVDTTLFFRCKKCDHEWDSPMPITKNFFRTHTGPSTVQ